MSARVDTGDAELDSLAELVTVLHDAERAERAAAFRARVVAFRADHAAAAALWELAGWRMQRELKSAVRAERRWLDTPQLNGELSLELFEHALALAVSPPWRARILGRVEERRADLERQRVRLDGLLAAAAGVAGATP